MNNRLWTAVRAPAAACCVLAGMLAGGCVDNDIVIRVKPDGSGQIIVSRVYTPQMVAMYEKQMANMKRMLSSRSADMSELKEMGIDGTTDLMFNEKALKKEADIYGTGVSFVKAASYEKNGARGSVAVYAFKDINQVFLSLDENSSELIASRIQAGFYPGMQDNQQPEPAERTDQSFGFKLEKGPVSKLKLILPAGLAGRPAAAPDPDDETDDDADAEMMEYAAYGSMGIDASTARMVMAGRMNYGRQQYEGARFALAVEVAGTVLKSTASHADKNRKGRFVLADVSADRMFASPDFKKRGTNPFDTMGGSGSAAEVLEQLSGLSWVTIETNSSATIEFK